VKGIFASCLIALATACRASAGDWPHWRGPDRNGISRETGWLDLWPSAGPPVAWKGQAGTGFSSFAVAAGRVFTMGNADNTDTVWCYDADSGKVLWKHSYAADLGEKFFEGGPTSTPTIDGERVYTLSRWGDLQCLDAASGKEIWSKNVQEETGARIPGWGFGGSPLVHENLLVLNVGEAGLALDKTTGKIVWHSADKEAGYSTPLPVKHGGEWLALFGSGQSYLAVDLHTGKEAWRVRWLTQYGINAADPIVNGDRVFISTGYGKGAALLQVNGAEPEQLWKSKALRTQMNPAVLFDGHLYGVDGDTTEKASLKCIEFATGKDKWSQPGFGSGSVIIADGKLIALSGAGELMVAPVSSDGFKPTARAQVLGGKCWTVPVLANGRILCRNAKGDVVCLDLRAKKP
jgi:outer membrane protein assembly factor BamB